jgi:hypothetical protein
LFKQGGSKGTGFFWLSYMGIMAFGAKYSGALYNPILTLGYLLNKGTDLNIEWIQLLFYLLF